jgi:23S rRNA (cytosine1962-C5)-methyltransferase
MQIKLLATPKLPNYELIDSGEAEKLERFGEVVLRRPDPQALWKKELDKKVWDDAHAVYIADKLRGKWQRKKEVPESWNINLDDINIELRLTADKSVFKHVGIFPEQYSNWLWIKETLKKNKLRCPTPQILNLFAYTGGATVAALQAGASVTHIDASSGSIEWAKRNAELSGVIDKPVRWIVDDARKFVEREIRRGNHYHGVILDPPAYGHGPKKEVWNIEDDFLPLMDSIKKVLHNEPLFTLINGYSAGYSALAYAENLSFLKGGEVEAGELSIEDRGGRHLPSGIFARWRR